MFSGNHVSRWSEQRRRLVSTPDPPHAPVEGGRSGNGFTTSPCSAGMLVELIKTQLLKLVVSLKRLFVHLTNGLLISLFIHLT